MYLIVGLFVGFVFFCLWVTHTHTHAHARRYSLFALPHVGFALVFVRVSLFACSALCRRFEATNLLERAARRFLFIFCGCLFLSIRFIRFMALL